MLDSQNYTIIDLETTGGSPYFNRIIEVGLLRVERGEVVSRYNQLINPEIPIPEIITTITGLTNNDVYGAPVFEQVADEILSYIEDSVFVAHNALFDYGFLKEEFRRLGYGFNIDRLCTVKLSRQLYPEHKHHNLSALIERYNFNAGSRHRAFDDANVLWQFLQKVQQEFPVDILQKTFRKSTTKVRIPHEKPPESIESF